jgi:peptidoglycan/xylan/chitin deacetylase (PgdA/CDA1 family)
MFVVNYHNVVTTPLDAFDRRSLRIPLDEFRAEMVWIRDHCHPMPLESLLDQARDGRVDPKAVAITFDDGYVGVEQHALPVLRELGLTATIFVISGTVDAPAGALRRDDEIEVAFRITTAPALRLHAWGQPDQPLTTAEDRRRAMLGVKQVLKGLKDELRERSYRRLLEQLGVTPEACRSAAVDEKFRLCDGAGLRRLAGAGWTVGSHSVTHRALNTLPEDEVRRELADSRRNLERRLGNSVTLLAYPYGGTRHVSPMAARLARDAGYRYALTAEPGSVGPDTDWHLVPRVSFDQLVTRVGA